MWFGGAKYNPGMMIWRSSWIAMELVLGSFSIYACQHEGWRFLWHKHVHEAACWEGCYLFFRRKQDCQTLSPFAAKYESMDRPYSFILAPFSILFSYFIPHTNKSYHFVFGSQNSKLLTCTLIICLGVIPVPLRELRRWSFYHECKKIFVPKDKYSLCLILPE